MPPKNISAARPLSGTVSIPICSATVSSHTYYVTHRAACKRRSPKLDFRLTEFAEARQESLKDHPCGGCTAPRGIVRLGATTPHRSVGKGVRGMHFLQIEDRISVEQVAQTSMREYL